MDVTMEITGDKEVSQKIRNAIKYSAKDAADITSEYGDKLQEQVKQDASGRPGPNIITGQYVASIHKVAQSTYAVTVGTDAPQALRLEYGFAGQDSLGRVYGQPPYPHWTPAVDKLMPEYVKAMQKAARSWFR